MGLKKTSKTKWFQLSDISVPHKLKQHFLFYQRLNTQLTSYDDSGGCSNLSENSRFMSKAHPNALRTPSLYSRNTT